MATAGRLPEAKAQYDELFHGDPPTLELAVEYWRLVARLPGQESAALKQLQTLDQQYSGNVPLRMSLARMLFSQDRDAQAYNILQKVAADPAGRGDAADLWLEKVKAFLKPAIRRSAPDKNWPGSRRCCRILPTRRGCAGWRRWTRAAVVPPFQS